MPALKRLSSNCRTLLLGATLATGACQPQREASDTAGTPPVGHYEGSLSQAGQPEVRAALDIRHPSAGHYEAELSVPGASALSFVADTLLFRGGKLQLKRPARPSQMLTLTLDGDFWRGSLALDSAKVTAILLKRGAPTPRTYHVEEVPQGSGSAWLFSPADTGTQGPALALLPDSATAAAAPLWADALARAGIIVLVLPVPAAAATPQNEATQLQTALRLLRGTAGADTANLGAWAAGQRALAVAQAAATPGGPRFAYFIVQNLPVAPADRPILRELRTRKLPVLGLYGGTNATSQAGALRNAMGGRRGAVTRVYRMAGPDLLVPGPMSSRLGPGLPDDVLQWLREK